MSKRGGRTPSPVFADLVAEVRKAPAPPMPPPATLISPDGTTFFDTGRTLEPVKAVELVMAGASVAWDSCGCLGGCGDLSWFEPFDRAEFVETGPPELRHQAGRRNRGRGGLTEWHTNEDRVLVLASQDVRWGRFMY